MIKKTVRCPNCETPIEIQGNPGETIIINCPKCDTKGKFTFPSEKQKIETPSDSFSEEIKNKLNVEFNEEKRQKKAEKKRVNIIRKTKETSKRGAYFSINQPFMIADIIEIILIIIGISILFYPGFLNIKIGFTLILIAIFMIFMITEESKINIIRGPHITIGIITWILLIFFITGLDIETFFILIFLGLLVIKEFTDESISLRLRSRINILISFFLLVLLVVIGQKIINI